MTRKVIPKIISNGGMILHYHNYRLRRKEYKPICDTPKENGLPWQLDDGVGAGNLCKTCENTHLKWRKQVNDARNRRGVGYYYKFRDKRIAAMKLYRVECREAINKQKRLKRRRLREEREGIGL